MLLNFILTSSLYLRSMQYPGEFRYCWFQILFHLQKIMVFCRFQIVLQCRRSQHHICLTLELQADRLFALARHQYRLLLLYHGRLHADSKFQLKTLNKVENRQKLVLFRYCVVGPSIQKCNVCNSVKLSLMNSMTGFIYCNNIMASSQKLYKN